MGILALTADERVTGVKFTKDALSVALRDGRTITVPLNWYPRLLKASAAQRKPCIRYSSRTIFTGLAKWARGAHFL